MGYREAAVADRSATRMCILARIVPECPPRLLAAGHTPPAGPEKNPLRRLAFGEFFTYTRSRLQIIECTRRSPPGSF